MRIAIIDLGTNSLRFDVYDVYDDEEFSLIHREKFMIRLGDDVFTTGQISEKVMDRAMETFDLIKIYIKEMKIKETFAYATSAMRTADNAKKFIKKVRKKIDVDIHIISGKEEAEKIALGILGNEKLPANRCLLVDIGGGSTEISFIKENDIDWAFSMPVGSLRLKQLFFEDFYELGIKKREKVIAAAKNHVQQVLEKSNQHFDKQEIETVLGSSGTIKSISRLIRKHYDQRPPLSYQNIELLLSKMTGMTYDEVIEMKGLEPKRRDLIIPGLVLFLCVLDYYGGTSVHTTRFALRDGLLVDVLQNQLY
ncbi:MAG: hypothetical protein VX583_06465 [Bdellovibrionota bacterium]